MFKTLATKDEIHTCIQIVCVLYLNEFSLDVGFSLENLLLCFAQRVILVSSI